MRNISLSTAVVGAFFVFCTALTAYQVISTTQPDRQTQSLKKKKILDSRELDLGQVKDQTLKVIDEPSVLFNDPAIKQAWGLKKSDAARAWSVTQGSRDAIVAVIDTGIDEFHEDLKKNLWTNEGESGTDRFGKNKATNGIDDDNNGFVDDIHGWNFVSNNNRLTDNHGHGTHIAGIIGAEAENKKGISGISPKVSLMILKYFDPKVPNTDNLKNTVAAIQYAIKMGAHIINYSGGGTDYSQEEHDAVELAAKRGILFVAAAGNERSNSDQHHYYPADYKLKNIISVTAIDPTTEVLASSNYGTETVDIAAPGQNILSSLPNNTYGLMTGTSQATAFITGAAVLVMSHKNQYYKAEDVKKYILATGDTSHSLIAKTKTSRQLNLYKSLTILSGEKAFSGADKSEVVQDSFYSDPKLNRRQAEDPNLKTAKNVAKFGKNLLEAMAQPVNKKNPTLRLGQDPKTPEQ